MSSEDNIVKYLEILFDSDDLTCLAENFYKNECSLPSLYNPFIHRLITLNPCKGGRKNTNVTKYRNFLVEIDCEKISTDKQLEFMHLIEMPYSTATFSGNKSVHFVISLEINLKNEVEFISLAKKIANAIDHNKLDTGVLSKPAIFTRAPCATRENGKEQRLLEIRSRVPNTKLVEWIEKRLVVVEPRTKQTQSIKYKTPTNKREGDAPPSLNLLRSTELRWLIDQKFEKGSRNNKWFRIGCQMYELGFNFEDALTSLRPFFREETDFNLAEWKICLRSSYRFMSENKG